MGEPDANTDANTSANEAKGGGKPEARNPTFYLIGTCGSHDIDHETAHAVYGLSASYREHAKDILADCLTADDRAGVDRWLLEQGYCRDRDILDDEQHAYVGVDGDGRSFGRHLGNDSYPRLARASSRELTRLYKECVAERGERSLRGERSERRSGAGGGGSPG